MGLTSVKAIKALLLKYHAHPSKMMGQNFLIDHMTLNKIIETADLKPKDMVLEIGPGIGTLTQELAKKVKKVIATEKDRVMAEILKETLKEYKNIEMIMGDALLDEPLADSYESASGDKSVVHYKVVANIPYYLTSPIIRKFLEAKYRPKLMVLMVQKEVAQRICAKPPNMSILSVSVQCYAKAQIISYVSRECFWPKPKVDSAIIKIVPFRGPEKISREKFFQVVKAGFLHPRRQLANNLSEGLRQDKEAIRVWLLKSNIHSLQRAETLTVQDWINLTNTL